MNIDFPYGETSLRLDIDDACVAGVLRSNFPPPLSDPAVALRRVLRHPVDGGPCLAAAARGARDLVIVVSDVTRPFPYEVVLPTLLELLEQEAGLSRQNISFLVATGLHRPTSDVELVEMLGAEVVSRYRVGNHDARNRQGHSTVGVTGRGACVRIDERYLAADFRIVTGLVEPHLMAGYSGGRKALCPGLADAETIGFMHGAALLSEPGVGCGRLDGNPLHEELLAAAGLAGCDFSINVTVDDRRRLTSVHAGGLDASHRAACSHAAPSVAVTAARAAAIVVVSGAGAPLDTTFYQAIKGVVAAAPVVEKGGTIILVARCAEGLGGDEFRAEIASFSSASSYLERLVSSAQFVVDQWQLQMLAKVMCKAKVVVVSEGLRDRDLEPLGIARFEDPGCALEVVFSGGGSGRGAGDGVTGEVLLMPEGPYLSSRCAPGSGVEAGA